MVNIILTESAKRNQIDAIKQKKYEIKCIEYYDTYVSQVMKEKKIEFFHEPFLKFVSDGYSKIFSEDDNKLKEIDFLNKEYGLNPNEDFFIYNDITYTVKELNNLIRKHPLVFRKEKIKSSEFPIQLKYR